MSKVNNIVVVKEKKPKATFGYEIALLSSVTIMMFSMLLFWASRFDGVEDADEFLAAWKHPKLSHVAWLFTVEGTSVWCAITNGMSFSAFFILAIVQIWKFKTPKGSTIPIFFSIWIWQVAFWSLIRLMVNATAFVGDSENQLHIVGVNIHQVDTAWTVYLVLTSVVTFPLAMWGIWRMKSRSRFIHNFNVDILIKICFTLGATFASFFFVLAVAAKSLSMGKALIAIAPLFVIGGYAICKLSCNPKSAEPVAIVVAEEEEKHKLIA